VPGRLRSEDGFAGYGMAKVDRTSLFGGDTGRSRGGLLSRRSGSLSSRWQHQELTHDGAGRGLGFCGARTHGPSLP
jgi:hypothetical protein